MLFKTVTFFIRRNVRFLCLFWISHKLSAASLFAAYGSAVRVTVNYLLTLDIAGTSVDTICIQHHCFFGPFTTSSSD